MPRKPNPDRLSAAFAANARREFGALRAALHSAEASLSKLRGSVHAVTIKPPRGRIPGSRSSPGLLLSAGASSLGGFLSREIVGDLFGDGGFSQGNNIGGSFQQSATQFAGKLFDASLRGQRIR